PRPTLVPPVPESESVELVKSQIAAQLGETITLHGHDLDGSGHSLLLTNTRLGISAAVPPATAPDATKVTFTLPVQPANFPAGTWAATLQLVHGSDPMPRLTNQLPLSIAPQITAALPSPVTAGSFILMPSCTPELRADQRVS